MSSHNYKSSFISSVTARLVSLLPHRTGKTLAETEINPQLLSTTNLILRNCAANDSQFHEEFVPGIMSDLIDILNKLNINQSTGKLVERGDNVLTSTVIVTRLLRMISIMQWDPYTRIFKEDEFMLDIGNDFELELGIFHDDFEFYALPPPKSIKLDFRSILEILFTLFSPKLNALSLSVIQRLTSNPRATDYNTSPTTAYSAAELHAHIFEIDSNISVVLRFLAAANPVDFQAFVKDKLFSGIERGEQIPTSVLQRYCCSLSFVYCTPENTGNYLKLVYCALPYIRSNIWKQLILFYEFVALQIQSVYKPGFYSEVISPDSAVETNCKTLFDYISSVFDSDSNISTVLHAWYVFLCPSDFDELLSKSSKIKSVFNKRIKFLNSILKDTQSGVNLDSFESLINLILLGAVLPSSKSGVSEFSSRHLDETYNTLKKMRSKCINETTLMRFRVLYQKFFTAAIISKPDVYVSFFTRTFESNFSNVDQIFETASSLANAQDFLDIVKALSIRSRHSGAMKVIIKRINSILLRIMHKSTMILAKKKEISLPEPSWVTNSGCFTEKSFLKSLSVERKIEKLSHSRQKSTDVKSTESANLIEHLLQLCFNIYTATPESYVNTEFENGSDYDATAKIMLASVEKALTPLHLAFHLPPTDAKASLFNAACRLCIKILKAQESSALSDEKHFIRMMIANDIIHSLCEMMCHLSNPIFKEYFVFLEGFLVARHVLFSKLPNNKYFSISFAHESFENVRTALDKLLMLYLCTHDSQFFSLLRSSTKAHRIKRIKESGCNSCDSKSIAESFMDVLGEVNAYMSFVSLHKKLRILMMHSQPTRGLLEAWIFIYHRWLAMIENRTTLNDESFTFKHYSEFLASTSGCFLSDKGSYNEKNNGMMSLISSFYDDALSLLSSEESHIRVVVRDALSAVLHSEIDQLIYDKLMSHVNIYKEQETVSDESIVFIEETISIFTAILSNKNDGAIFMAALLPEICETFFDFISTVPELVDQIKLKLRLCKLISVISADRERIGVCGAYKLRNSFAKIIADWLDLAVSYDLEPPLTSNSATSSNNRTSHVDYLQVELATECSRSLELQLSSLVLSIPDGTKEQNVRSAQELVFSSYFSMFYKILQRYNVKSPPPMMMKAKFKLQTITEHVSKAISNMLQSNFDSGLQFALPLGFHDDDKIRQFFLEIFATTISAKKLEAEREEFADDVVFGLSEIYELYGAVAGVASPTEHNLLANSLNGLFGYTMRLDKLFVTLLKAEIRKVSRASDIFRGNSTLTRLMSIFAKEYGTPYLSVVLKPYVEEMADKNVVFEIEKYHDQNDVKLFLEYLQKLVDRLMSSMPWVPESFKFICSEIHKCVGSKFKDASLIAVGSFLFLRFFCPAIVSPESFFDLTSINSKVKRSMIQIVKVIQYMANGSITNLKWASLTDKIEIVSEMNSQIFKFIEQIALGESKSDYAFHRLTLKPVTSLRYIHKFLYTYFVNIRRDFMLTHSSTGLSNLHEKTVIWRKLDTIVASLGNPKSYISLQGSKSFRAIDTQANIGNTQFAEFMAKMSAKNIETSVESPVLLNTVSQDGMPMIVINFRHIKDIGYDIGTFVYLILENSSQIWDSNFYCVYDFTQFFYIGIIGMNFVSLMRNYAPKKFFANCKKTYFYNLPRASHLNIIEALSSLREEESEQRSSYLYSEQDKPEIIKSLRLSDSISGIPGDVKLICNGSKLYDEMSQSFTNVTVKLGRSWLSIWFDRVKFDEPYTVTNSVAPAEVIKLTDLTRCEITKKSGEENEFTLFLNRYNYQITLVTPQRSEILRYLYFAMLRTSKPSGNVASPFKMQIENAKRFGVISNMMFHGLLRANDDVKSAAAKLIRSFCFYFEIEPELTRVNLKIVAFPVDMTEFVSSFSHGLANSYPMHSRYFLSAFFSNFDKLPDNLKVSGIMYASPWITDLHENLSDRSDGMDALAATVRQLTKITIENKSMIPVLKEYVWTVLFKDMKMISILVEELVAMAMEAAAESEDWDIIISLFSPSVELCGEVVSKLKDCISQTNMNDSEIAVQSKILEITVLVKLCATLFFNSIVFGTMYLSDVFLFCSLFIDRSDLEFGYDLQRLVIHTIQSFYLKRNLKQEQLSLIEDTVEYFSGQRAKMLFGLTFKDRASHVGVGPNYERAVSFELLCDYLLNFISKIGDAEEKRFWVSRWASLAKDIAFSESVFQRRAYTVVCTLARSGISDSVGGRFMEILTSHFFDSPDTFFEGAISLFRLKQGLAKDSVYLPILVWVDVGTVLSSFAPTYQASVSSLADSMVEMIYDECFTDKVFSLRANLEPLLTILEERIDCKIFRSNHEFVFLTLFSKGLTMSHFRHTSISILQKVLSKMFKKRTYTSFQDIAPDDYVFGYILMFYLSVSDSVYSDFLSEHDMQNIEGLQIDNDIPRILIDAMCDGCSKSQSAFVLAAHIFSEDCEQVYKLKFIHLYQKIFKHQRKLALMMFHLIESTMEECFISSSTVSLTSEVSKLLMEVVKDPNYDPKIGKQDISTLLKEISCQNLDKVSHFYSLNDADEAAHRMILVRQMLYRSLCSVVDGSKLERY